MKVIITGSTGMVGNSEVSEVLSISRKSCGIKNPKLKELLVSDFTKLQDFENDIQGYNACFYCAGISSAGMTEERIIISLLTPPLRLPKHCYKPILILFSVL